MEDCKGKEKERKGRNRRKTKKPKKLLEKGK